MNSFGKADFDVVPVSRCVDIDFSTEEARALFWSGPATHAPGSAHLREGERLTRFATLERVLAALRVRLGSAEAVAFWLRSRNPELFGLTPLSWMSGPTRMMTQIAMRIEAENMAAGLDR